MVPGLATGVEDGVVAVEHTVREPVCSEVLPDILHRVQLRRSRWQHDDGKVLRDLEIVGLVPSCSVHQHSRMSPTGDVFADLVEMQLHGVGVGLGEHQSGPRSPFRADGAEQVGVLVALISWEDWPRAPSGPDANPSVLLPKPRLILEPDLNGRGFRQVAYVGGKRGGEVFLNSSITRPSWPGCFGRPEIWENPSSAR